METEEMQSAVRVPATELRTWAAQQLCGCGVSEEDAMLVAGSLVQTSLWGIDSHGIARLPHYLRRLSLRSTNPWPRLKYEQTGPCTGSLDGDHGLGILVSHRAMDQAIAMAQENGVGIVGCSRSTHCGAIGLFGRQAAEKGLIGIAFTHSDSFVAPHNGKHAFLGTNPICIAVPCEQAKPVCVDIATSEIPINYVMNARRDGSDLNSGVALDQEGNPTIDPNEVAALLPMARHKGYALAFLIDLLCGPLNGMPYGPHISAMYGDLTARRDLGALMVAIHPARFPGGASLSTVVRAMAEEARRQRSVSPHIEVLVPGDPEYHEELVREKHGIPIEPNLLLELGVEGLSRC